MHKSMISFTEKGSALIKRINDEAVKAGIEPGTDLTGEDISLEEMAKREFSKGNALIFIGAAGIAVRAISDCVNDKLTDSPVLVIDDDGQFVIPILAGHAGGANKIAVTIAKLIDAVPVITTATDVNGAFSADVFAAENNLRIRNREGIKTVSAKALEGKSITLSIKDYPPKEPVDIMIADETDREYSLLMSPKRYVIGIGSRKDKDPAEFERFVSDVLGEYDISTGDIYAIATIDVKEDESAIKQFSNRHKIPVITFEANVLSRAPGDFSSSEFVKDTVGVDNVCERAAILASAGRGEFICRKRKGDGITVAIVKRA